MPNFPIYVTEGQVRVPGYLLTLLGITEGTEVELFTEGMHPYIKAIIRPAIERVTIGRKGG